MKKGDLVRREPEWGPWTKYNPWMISEKDLEVGIVIETHKTIVPVSWSDGNITYEKIINLRNVKNEISTRQNS